MKKLESFESKKENLSEYQREILENTGATSEEEIDEILEAFRRAEQEPEYDPYLTPEETKRLLEDEEEYFRKVSEDVKKFKL